MTSTPGPNVINIFCPKFKNFCNKLVCFPGKLFQPRLTNTQAYYENSLITAVKSFMTSPPGGHLSIHARPVVAEDIFFKVSKRVFLSFMRYMYENNIHFTQRYNMK